MIEFGSQEHEGQQVFFVRDNGIGFDPNHAKGIFEPFHRLHPTDDFPGSGIGLAIVRRVIRRHQGRIWTEGAAGKGATFYFTLTPDFVNLNAEDAL